MTRSQVVQADVSALLRARNPLLWVITREEARAERLLIEAAASAGYTPRTWDCGQGVASIDGVIQRDIGGADVDSTLEEIRDRASRSGKTDRGAWIMRDLHPWIAPGPLGISTCRKVRNLARTLPGADRNKAQALIVLTPSREVPPELAGHATVIEWPLPDREEISQILDGAVEVLPEFETDPETKKPDPAKPLRALACPNGQRDLAIDAATGLTGEEAANCYALSLVQTKRIDPARIAQEKKRIISRDGLLEWFDPLPGGLNAVGGAENLKAWFNLRVKAYTKAARARNLPPPKGVLLGGLPGTGKSLIAKAVATEWGVPLLRLDMGALRSKYVGESEQNLRKALKVIDAIGRCVVWPDEVEKALQGGTSGSADGGVSADALGMLLSWLQERKGEAFIVATANDVEALPPELLRKGRFDEVWWFDLPTIKERAAILRAALVANGRGEVDVTVDEVAVRCHDFVGSEVAAIVPEAMFAAFADGDREIITQDLIDAARNVTPLVKTAATKIEKLREWAKTNGARRTSVEEGVEPARKLRSIDI